MNSDLQPSGESQDAPPVDWRLRLEAWRELLAECSCKPSRKRVLALRSLSLRLQAQLDFAMQQQPTASAAARAFRRWSRQTKKLRLALQPARDADVFLSRLESLGRPAGAMDNSLQPSPLCLREIETLEFQLHRRRLAGTRKLTEFIDARRQRLNRRSREMETAIWSQIPEVTAPSRASALQVFSELAAATGSLDKTSLHDYRKRLKQALYLAEVSVATEPVSAQLVVDLRKIHNAIGEWHDLQTLAEEAAHLLSKHESSGDQPPISRDEVAVTIQEDRKNGLISLLEARTEEALKIALERCHEAANRLSPPFEEREPSPPRKPVASVRGDSISVAAAGS